MFTQDQLQNSHHPKQQGAIDLLNKITKIYKSRKLFAVSKIHLYSLHIESKRNIRKDLKYEPLNVKVQKNFLALFLMKYFVNKKSQWAVQKYFFNWKYKTQLFEWRMNQSHISEKLNDTNVFFENYFTPKSAAIQQKL